MNRPMANAMDHNFVQAMHRAFDEIEEKNARSADENRVKAVAIVSEISGYFSFGFDLPTLARSDKPYVYAMLFGYLELIRRICAFPLPVIALVEGHCMAGGLVLALATDYRIGTDNGKTKYMLNETNLNIPFPRGTVELISSVCGPENARSVLFSSKAYRTAAALELGLIDEVVPAAEGRLRLANRLQYYGAKPAFGFRKLKAAKNGAILDSMARDIQREELNALLEEMFSETTRQKVSRLVNRIEKAGLKTNVPEQKMGAARGTELQRADSADLLQVMENRRSTRAYLEKEVPPEIFRKVLSAALRAPSSKNTQPWKIALVTKNEMKQLSEAFLKNFMSGLEANRDFAEQGLDGEYMSRARALGAEYYGHLKIDRKDKEARRNIWARNYEFWGAPAALYLYTLADVGPVETFDCGIFFAHLILALEAAGLSSIPQASLTDYPDVVRSVLGLPPNAKLIAGLSFGYADAQAQINHFKTSRLNAETILNRSVE